jgi:hypothetical protein
MAVRPLLIPVQRYTRQKGVFVWPREAVLASVRLSDRTAMEQMAGNLRGRGVKVRLEYSGWSEAAVRIQRTGGWRSEEAYRLRVGTKGVEIFSGGDAGAYYALQTLRELVTIHGGRLPACAIEDGPDFPRRGVYHDCSRGKVPTLETLKALVERLARWKINELQLYVENVFRFKRHADIGRGYSPFTAEEILDLQEHCRKHHVRLVGSLATLGHMEKILSLPAYRTLAELPGFRGYAGGTTLCPDDPG